MRSHDPNYKFETMTINRNYAGTKISPTNRRVIGLGNYTGGELVFTDKTSPHYGSHNIRNKWLKFDGRIEHNVKLFKSTRYTMVFCIWWT
eukprot:SAG11_NODE_4934_length_1718_cov_2.140828_2_plen_90_part_00